MPGEIAHGSKDGQDLLGMVANGIGFLADFHQHMDDFGVRVLEP